MMLTNANNFASHQSMQKKMRGSIMLWRHMPVFSEACMCLRWPGRTVAGQKQVSKDDWFFNNSYLGMTRSSEGEIVSVQKSEVLFLKRACKLCGLCWSLILFELKYYIFKIILNNVLWFVPLLSLLPFWVLIPSGEGVAHIFLFVSNMLSQHTLSILIY